MTAPITLVDVAPRDGLQSDGAVVPTPAKLELLERIAAAGIRRVEATSFVNPSRVPQMADAAELMAAVAARRAGAAPDDPMVATSFIGLVLNRRGLDRALDAGCDEVNAVVVVTDTFSQKNQGTDTDRGIEVWEEIAGVAAEAGVPASVTLAASFGCPYEGEVPVARLVEVAGRCAAAGGDEIALADSIGVAAPTDVTARVDAVREVVESGGSGQRLRVHFHNTRNTGLANVAAAVQAGVTVVDGSLGGIGGCPFAPNATGNVPTEDVAYMLHRMGHDVGADLAALVDVVEWMQSDALLGRAAPGLLARAGLFP
jgi:hydroxymethylglutaryl-CoA lyase